MNTARGTDTRPVFICGSTSEKGSETRTSSGTDEGSTASSDEDSPRNTAARPRLILRWSTTGAGAGAAAGAASSGGIAGNDGGGKKGRCGGGAKECGTGLADGGGCGEERNITGAGGSGGSLPTLFWRTVTGLGCTGIDGGGTVGGRTGDADGPEAERSEIGGIWMRWVFFRDLMRGRRHGTRQTAAWRCVAWLRAAGRCLQSWARRRARQGAAGARCRGPATCGWAPTGR